MTSRPSSETSQTLGSQRRPGSPRSPRAVERNLPGFQLLPTFRERRCATRSWRTIRRASAKQPRWRRTPSPGSLAEWPWTARFRHTLSKSKPETDDDSSEHLEPEAHPEFVAQRPERALERTGAAHEHLD